jgi:hypothetical protein
MRLPYSMGIELTGVPKLLFDTQIDRLCSDGITTYKSCDWDRIEKYKQMMQDELGKKLQWERAYAHIDSHCFEVPSPIFRTSLSMRKWFVRVRKIMKKHGLTPHHDDAVCGGGHIHVGISNQDLRLKVVKSVRQNFFLPWVFSQPDSRIKIL